MRSVADVYQRTTPVNRYRRCFKMVVDNPEFEFVVLEHFHRFFYFYLEAFKVMIFFNDFPHDILKNREIEFRHLQVREKKALLRIKERKHEKLLTFFSSI